MVFVRADSNSIIASGHIMRCLSISKAIMSNGEVVHFLLADENASSVLKEAGIDYTVLNSDWQNLMSDADQVKKILQSDNNPILLIDTYSVTKEYVEYLSPYAKIVFLGSKQDYLGNVDILINYSADIDFGFYNRYYSEGTRLLLGPKYAPLREEFQNVSKTYKNFIERILLTTGNTDRDHMVNAILQLILPSINETNIVVDVIIGRMFDDKEGLHRNYDNNNHVCFHENVKSMSTLMLDCDLAISANGTTVFELSAIGLPAITFAMVPEQVKSAEALSDLGVIDYCGSSYVESDSCLKNIKSRVDYYLYHNDELISLGKAANKLIDGNGCKKITEMILSIE